MRPQSHQLCQKCIPLNTWLSIETRREWACGCAVLRGEISASKAHLKVPLPWCLLDQNCGKQKREYCLLYSSSWLLFFLRPQAAQVDNTQEVYTPNFDVFLLNQKDVAEAAENPYIKKLSEDSLLAILQPKRAKKAFEKKETRESSIFHLFLN